MSPEQAKGRVADKRSDVWAFGCVLYEMLTGTRAFDGEDVSDVLATVLKSEPDWTAFPSGVPAPIQNIVKRCLAKDRKARIPDMSVVRFLFDDAASAATEPAAPTTSARPRASAIVWKLATALLLLTTIAGFAGWYAARSMVPAVARFDVLPPEKGSFVITTGGSPQTAPHAAISPDGRTLAFAVRDAAGRVSLWVRPIDSVTSQSLAGTDGASYPFWSPDSRFIAYFAGGKLIKIPAAGGPTQTLCAGGPRGGTWSRDGVIAFNSGPGPLLRVSSAGGEPVPLTKEVGSFPSFLPDGRHLLFFRSAGRIDVASVDNGDSKPLINADSGGVYARSGYLLFVRQGTLLGQSFDAKTMTLSGEPFPIAERVQTGTPAGHIAFSVSDSGVLAYGVATSRVNAGVQLTWMNRQGKVTGTVGAPEDIRGVDLSPDGARLATHRHVEGQGGDVWITDLSRGTTSRFTFDATQDNASPIWSPDAGSIAFSLRRGAKSGVYRKASNGSGDEEMLVEQLAEIAPTGWSPDGRSIVYSPNGPGGAGPDLWMLPLAGDRKPIRLLSTRFSEGLGQVSPDGRWLAYASNESGNFEIYAQPFPPGAGKWQISTGGGTYPRWRRDGRELFYMDQTSGGRLIAVDVKANGSTFEAGTPKPLFDSGYINRPHAFLYHPYTLTPDGQRFLIPRPVAKITEDTTSSPVIVVMNWAEGIKR
jgi:Tol biopolymer transport system component